MAGKRAKVRLFVDAELGPGQAVPLSRDAAHYLFGVMRLEADDLVALFNGRDGEWTARVVSVGKRKGILVCVQQSAPQTLPPDLWLVFAPVKKARTDFIVEKATEMGVRRILPVQTRFTNSDRFRVERQQAHAIEAAEQCGATHVPTIEPLQPLDRLLGDWPAGRRLLFCDEALAGTSATPKDASDAQQWAILIGPEGGFSPDERQSLRQMPDVMTTSLGPRILRADTAAVAALALWQSRWGDWR